MRKLVSILIVYSILCNYVIASESSPTIVSTNQEESIVLEEIIESSPLAQNKVVEPPSDDKLKLQTETKPDTKPAKEKGIFNTILGWFSENETEQESAAITPHDPAKKPKPVIIGLALGGGAAKGFAHIGVIKALEENGIKPKIITGTSAGSLVGSLYAYGYSPKQLEKIAYQLDGINLADFTLNTNGLIKGQKLQDFVNKNVQDRPLQKLKIKFAAVATDLDSGDSVGFNYGNTGVAVRASCAVPNIVLPVKIDKHRYVDGGLSAPVPVSYAKKMGANLIIAVDITSKPEHTKAKGFLSNLDQTLNIMGVKLLNEQLKLANFVIKPDISKLSSFSFDKKKQAMMLGYRATLPLIPKIKQQIIEMQQD